MSRSTPKQTARIDAETAGTRVLVVDDHVFIAQLLEDFLKKLDGYTCVGVARNGLEALQAIEALDPDILVTDLDMPQCGGLEVVQALQAKKSRVQILIFSGLSNFEAVRHALQNGVQGFLEKSIGLGDFREALEVVKGGDYFVSPAINKHLRDIVRQSLHDPLLDGTDMKVLRLYADDVPVKAIADEVGLSQSGVYKVLTRLKAKVGSENSRDMRIFAAQLGLGRGPTSDLWRGAA